MVAKSRVKRENLHREFDLNDGGIVFKISIGLNYGESLKYPIDSRDDYYPAILIYLLIMNSIYYPIPDNP